MMKVQFDSRVASFTKWADAYVFRGRVLRRTHAYCKTSSVIGI
jgi:hypothetical protein